jgi:homoserine kinase
VAAGQPLDAADLCNGFLRAALAVFPGLAETKSSLEARTGRRWCLSGAGPALFCLASSRRDATRLRAQLEDVELPCFVAHTVRHGRAISYAGPRPIGYP